MKVGSLEIIFHRTVRVAQGRAPSNLPPSLGTMKAYKVSDYKDKCPATWDTEAVFVALHDTEALWLSFRAAGRPVAVMVGAGGINALTGKKLGTKLAEGGYLVAPPQPWLDGWKSDDGCVYQFVASPYKGGKGVTVAEQLIGEESKTGAIGLAVFESRDPNLKQSHGTPVEGYGLSPVQDEFTWTDSCVASCPSMDSAPMMQAVSPRESTVPARPALRTSLMSEMGVGKGGKIRQKVYPDPYGLDAWQDAPVAAIAVYVVNAVAFEEITGEKIPKPVGHESYKGQWFGLQDELLEDVQGTDAFTGLKSAAFIGDTSNVVENE